MLLTITTTRQPATDLGYLLHKHPGRCQSFPLSFGQAHVFYPEATDDRCTAALLLDVDPVGLVRGPSGRGQGLWDYVNDRPYVASSFLSVALSHVYGTALAGRCVARPDLVGAELPLRAKLSVVPCRGGERVLRRLFEPLGYRVTAQGYPLDARYPDWGDSSYFTVGLEATCRLKDLLAHLYVLVPVLDDDKHYWVGADEVGKLLRHGGDWLPSHPARDLIAERYLKHQRRLARQALATLLEEDQADPDEAVAAHAEQEEAVEAPLGLGEQRLGAVLAVLKASGARRVLDLGCGEGRLLQRLAEESSFTEITGLDTSYRCVEIARERLHLDRPRPGQEGRVTVLHGSLIYRDKRLAGYDAAAVVEVIEHLDSPRLGAFERVLFEFARPRTIVLTTPNSEYNVRFADLPAGKLRHQDHRFEWTRAQFRTWAEGVARRFGYSVRFLAVGPEDPAVGPPTQMGVFTRA